MSNRNLYLVPCVAVLLGCPGSDEPAPSSDSDSDSDSGSETGDGEIAWEELVGDLQDGVLLSGWSTGDSVIFVGGKLSPNPASLPGGPGYIARLTNGVLCHEPAASENTLWWIDGTSANDYFITGGQGTILHVVDGHRIDESVQTAATLYGVWASGDAPVAVGGTIVPPEGEVWVRGNTGTWELLADELPGTAFKVWENMIVGDGVAWTLENGALVEHHPPGGERLTTVIGRSPTDIWAVGGLNLPILMHFDGTTWETVDVDPLCARNGLNGVWTAPGEPVWIAGFQGGMGVLDGDAWTCPDGPITLRDMHAVLRHDDAIFFVGGDLFVPNNVNGTIVRRGSADFALQPCE